MDLCVVACQQLGGVGEVVLVVLALGRWLYAEVRRRRIEGEKQGLQQEKQQLREQVALLSMPPGARVPGPTLQDLGIAISGSPVPPAPLTEHDDTDQHEPGTDAKR